MQKNNRNLASFSITALRAWLIGTALLCCSAFGVFTAPKNTPIKTTCAPRPGKFSGYTFIHPDIINKRAAYAPFLVEFGDMYRDFFNKDIQKEENLEEWNGRFCQLATPAEVERVVYDASSFDLSDLRSAAVEKNEGILSAPLLSGNAFAAAIANAGCTEVVDYLLFTRRIEPYVVYGGDTWNAYKPDTAEMHLLIREGVSRFYQTESHFIRLRYAYQVVRLSHYCREWQQTVDLFNTLLPKTDRRKPSIIYLWAVGHLAGALQKLGKNPEAAYRYSLIFRYCPSKRAQAFRSFKIKNDAEWTKAMRLCQNDSERSNLLIMRAATTRNRSLEDLKTVYALDPENPTLDLIAISETQQLEKIFLRTRITDEKYGLAESAIRREKAADYLIQFKAFVNNVVKKGHTANPKLWHLLDGYLEVISGDTYAAKKRFASIRDNLDPKNDYEAQLLRQLDVWDLLVMILETDPGETNAEDASFRFKSFAVFKEYPGFEPFLADWIAAGYEENKRPGKAFVTAYGLRTLQFNPSEAALDDLISAARSQALGENTTTDSISAENEDLLWEMKGTMMLSLGKMEAALAAFRNIRTGYRANMTGYSPFKERFSECIGQEKCPAVDSVLVNRLEYAEKMLDYEFRAKASQGKVEEAWYYYLLGLGHYNTSYFGYEWEVRDFFRSGANQSRLSQGPVFPLVNAPDGNRENLDLGPALACFQKVLETSKSAELSARAAFMAAKCQQKQWLCTKECAYRPGNSRRPAIPPAFTTYGQLLKAKYSKTDFYSSIVKECTWMR